MRSAPYLSLLALAALAAAAPAHNHVLHEKRDVHPRGWKKTSVVPRDITMPMRIGLTQSNLHLVEEMIMDVSHPDSPNYGNHYTDKQIDDIFAPSQESIDAVKSWLESEGLTDITISFNKQWIQFDATVETAEELFKTEYHMWEHGSSGKNHVGCDEYHVPSHIQEHIDYVLPGLRLMPGKESLKEKVKKREAAMKKRENELPFGPIIGNPTPTSVTNLSRAEQATMCTATIFPICIEQLYNFTQGGTEVGGNDLGIFEEGDFYGKQDLLEYFTAFAQNVPPAEVPQLNSVDGGFDVGVATGESDLDFQLAIPIVYPQGTQLFQTDDLYYSTVNFTVGNGIFNTFLDAIDGSYCTYKGGNSPIDPKYPDTAFPAGYEGPLMCGTYKATNIISVSYGLAEASMPVKYMQRQCAEYAKLGMKGVSLIFATQDAGVAARYQIGNATDDCLSDGTVFAPDFPANCPWVTGVGSTAYNGTEHATDQFGSGAGFSNVYPRPSYQAKAVSNYLTQYEPKLTNYKSYTIKTPNANPPLSITKGGVFNYAGRAYPDLSAIGENILIILDGAPITVGGTSAATPVFAALMTRINGARIQAKKKPLGFLNPALYANPSMFNDITVGNSPGCGGNGFFTAPGWDPSTGLGSPNYPALYKYFTSLK